MYPPQCNLHPRYKAKRKPRANCPTCEKMWKSALWVKISNDDEALEKAANVLNSHGSFHHWWPKDMPNWDSDPIAKNEFLGIVVDIIASYEAAK